MIGLKTINPVVGNTTIDSARTHYCYLGKYAVPNTGGDITINCVGFPIVFFSIPYAIADTTGSWPESDLPKRYGAAVAKLRQISSTQWVVTMAVWNHDNRALGLQLRVFGMVHANYPNGSGAAIALRIRNPATNQVTWDSGLRHLRLAGNTYSTELPLTHEVPPFQTANNSKDLLVNMPFSMANKSICANTRGLITMPFNVSSYESDGQQIQVYDLYDFGTGYFATGSQLQARRLCMKGGQIETGNPLVIQDTARPVYTQLSVIDNTLYP